VVYVGSLPLLPPRAYNDRSQARQGAGAAGLAPPRDPL